MKRITGLLLAVVIVLGVMSAGTFPVSAESALVASDECIRVLKEEEGFSFKPYWDYTQWTVGFGTRCPDDMLTYYKENGITEAEAEVLLRNHLASVELDLNNKVIGGYGLALTQNQFDALVLFSYNCGTGWISDPDGTLPKALKSGATGNDLIRAFAVWCNAGGQIKDYLLRRRLSESNMYLNGVYSRTPPDNYCYVYYDANGGTTRPKSQGYDSNIPVAPYPTPTYDGYTFDGWYTGKYDGTKITALDASTKGTTLYAHWVDAQGNAPVREEISVQVTVNANGVNLRRGPGTNYTVVGQANTGDQMTITETASGTGLQWGKFDGGWICLQYTNFETASQNPSNPGESSTESTDPTTPETTEPPTSEAPATEAPTTEAPTTEAPTTTAPADTTQPSGGSSSAQITGTVNVNEYLNIRSGPSTGYSIVGRLNKNDRVEILQQQTNGTMIWGKIDRGWISMDYILLDSSSGSASDNTFTAQWTGVVANCTQVRLRSGPGTSYACLGYLQAGTRVEIAQKQTNGSMVWGKLSNGWVSLDYVALDGDSSTADGENVTLTGVVTVNEYLRIRSGPGTSYAVAGYLKPNETVQITERRYNGSTPWGKIDKGWISMDYVKLTDGSSTSTGSSSGGESETLTGIVTVNQFLRIRSGPGISYSLVDYLNPNDVVTITARQSVGSTVWGKIDRGWISMDYVKLTDGTTQTPSAPNTDTSSSNKKTVIADCLNIRSDAGTGNSIVGYLYYGSKVDISETKDVDGRTWGRMNKGWICMDYVQ